MSVEGGKLLADKKDASIAMKSHVSPLGPPTKWGDELLLFLHFVGQVSWGKVSQYEEPCCPFPALDNVLGICDIDEWHFGLKKRSGGRH